MPITSPIPLCRISQEEFKAIDYRVMRLAFACQNELGRLCDESIYQNDLTARLEAAGLPLTRNGAPFGNQRLQMLSPDVAFRITALPEIDAREYEKSLCSLLRHSALRAVQWLNIFQHTVHLVTLTR